MIHVDALYAFVLVVGVVVFLIGVGGLFIELANDQNAAFAIVTFMFIGAAFLVCAAYHSGQTYHPCVTEWSTMKQACK